MKRLNKKLIVASVACAMLLIGSIASSLAWLVSTTGSVENTFTTSDVDITLTETTGDSYKMIPGYTRSKDPTVTVKSVSEKCYVFVEVTKTNDPDKYLNYSIDSGWKVLDENAGIYYMIVEDTDADQTFKVLTDNQVVVKTSVTKSDMAAAKDAVPKLTFKAYAIQYYIAEGKTFSGTTELDQAKNAWANVTDPADSNTENN